MEEDGRWREEVSARVADMLRREPVPPAEILEYCCAILDEAVRNQRPDSAGSHTAQRYGFDLFARADPWVRAGAGGAAGAVQEALPENSLPLRSLQPGYPKYDARSQRYVDRYEGREPPGEVMTDKRDERVADLARKMAEAKPPSRAAAQGTHIGGGYSRSLPMHQGRFKRITLRPTNLAAWAAVKAVVPDLATAVECTILNFPAREATPQGAEGTVDVGRKADEDLSNTAQRTMVPKAVPKFVDPQKVDLIFTPFALMVSIEKQAHGQQSGPGASTGGQQPARAPGGGGGDSTSVGASLSGQPSVDAGGQLFRKVTLPPEVANLLKDLEGEIFYDWHPDSFSRTAGRLYAPDGETSTNVVEKRIAEQRAEKAKRVAGKGVDWAY
mmetsp:Transcript_20159/g.63653  ORF Transcript_20159/g.63653 Transcript_20159/m.63653 type:complete len:385 (+) Transcript_20159:3-1157(+)